MSQAPPPLPSPQPPSPLRRMLARWSVPSLVGIAVLVIFVVQNTKDVTLHFLVASFTWPLWLYTVVVAVVGAMAWAGIGAVRRYRRRREERRAEEAEPPAP